MSRTLRIAVVAVLMTGFLIAMAGQHALARRSGTEIVLAMEPVDPRDWLLGYYVRIQTPVHRIDTAALPGPREGWEEGDVVRVALEEDQDGLWQPIAFARGRGGAPDGAGSKTVTLAGRVEWAGTLRDFEEIPESERDEKRPFLTRRPIEGSERPVLNIVYNLERYYADEMTTKALENLRDEQRLALIVSVGDDGAALIKGLSVDGEASYDTLF